MTMDSLSTLRQWLFLSSTLWRNNNLLLTIPLTTSSQKMWPNILQRSNTLQSSSRIWRKSKNCKVRATSKSCIRFETKPMTSCLGPKPHTLRWCPRRWDDRLSQNLPTPLEANDRCLFRRVSDWLTRKYSQMRIISIQKLVWSRRTKSNSSSQLFKLPRVKKEWLNVPGKLYQVCLKEILMNLKRVNRRHKLKEPVQIWHSLRSVYQKTGKILA